MIPFYRVSLRNKSAISPLLVRPVAAAGNFESVLSVFRHFVDFTKRGEAAYLSFRNQKHFQVRNFSSQPEAPQACEKVLYSKSHEYVRFLQPDGLKATVGISQFAAEELGEVVFIESLVPVKGEKNAYKVNRGDPVCTLEALKAVAEVYAPFTGHILKYNEKVKHDPGVVSRDPEGEGWIFKMAVDTPRNSEENIANYNLQEDENCLLTPEAYAVYVRREAGDKEAT